MSLFTAEVKDADKQQAQVLSQGIQASLQNHAGKSVKRANEGNPVRWTLTTTWTFRTLLREQHQQAEKDAFVMLDSEQSIADIASHRVPGNWPEGSVLFFFNPASGTVEVRPEHRSKVARSRARHARSIKRSLFRLQLRLQVEYFALQVRFGALKMSRYCLRLAEKTVGYAHVALPRRRNHAD